MKGIEREEGKLREMEENTIFCPSKKDWARLAFQKERQAQTLMEYLRYNNFTLIHKRQQKLRVGINNKMKHICLQESIR